MNVWKLLTILFCGYKFIDRGFEVLCFKTYCLLSKVTNMNTRQAISPFESSHCWIEQWKSLKRQTGECTSWSMLILLGIFWILVNDVVCTEMLLYSYKYQRHNCYVNKFLQSCSYIMNVLELGPCAWIWVLILNCLVFWLAHGWYFHFWVLI